MSGWVGVLVRVRNLVAQMKLLEVVSSIIIAAAQCPAERPNARQVVVWPQSQQCTLMARTPRLVCPDSMSAQSLGAKCQLVPTNDCNRCYPEVQTKTLCFTDEEITKSRSR